MEMWQTIQESLGLGDWSEHALASWGVATIIFVVVTLALALVKRLLAGRLHHLSKRTALDAFEIAALVVERTKVFFFMAVGLGVATTLIVPSERFGEVIDAIVIVTLLVQLGLWLSETVAQIIERYNQRLEGDPDQASALSVVRIFARFAVWLVIALLVLDNLGFDIVTLVAGLGIGGVALALAVQNILGDLFASLSILVDKPFVVGDFIVVGDQMGTVEKIGLKTTRLRSLGGEQIVFSNNDLLQSRIHNHKRMDERRIVFEFGVVQQTPADKLERIPVKLCEIIEELEQTRFDRAHFMALGESSLRFEVVYYALSAEYLVYMDAQQAINLKMLEFFRAEGIELAYPTRTIYVAGEDEQIPSVETPTAVSA